MARKHKKGRTSPHVYITLGQLNLKEQLAKKDADLKRAHREIKDLRGSMGKGKRERRAVHG